MEFYKGNIGQQKTSRRPKSGKHKSKNRKVNYKVDIADRLYDYKAKNDMALIEETRRRVDQEIKMLKQTPKISDKSHFITKKVTVRQNMNLG